MPPVSEGVYEHYRRLFWDAFHRPKLESSKFLEIWQNLEPVNDTLAGPLYAIYEKGECDYMFNDKEKFPTINEPDDFLEAMVRLVEYYKNGVEQVVAANEAEEKDKVLLLYQADIKMELTEIAYQIQSERI